LRRAREIAMGNGLQHVYLANRDIEWDRMRKRFA